MKSHIVACLLTLLCSLSGSAREKSGVAQPPIYYHFHWRGSTVALSNQSGNVTARLSYSPYGEETIESGTVDTPVRFNGQWGVMTEPTGLLHMQAR